VAIPRVAALALDFDFRDVVFLHTISAGKNGLVVFQIIKPCPAITTAARASTSRRCTPSAATRSPAGSRAATLRGVPRRGAGHRRRLYRRIFSRSKPRIRTFDRRLHSIIWLLQAHQKNRDLRAFLPAVGRQLKRAPLRRLERHLIMLGAPTRQFSIDDIL